MKPIRASELGSYLYCRRAWWYHLNGEKSANQAEMTAGTELHRQHGRKVLAAGVMRAIGFILILAACLMLTVFGLMNYLG